MPTPWTAKAPWLTPLALALVWTALNLAKPVHVDDTYHWAFARQTAAEPDNPLGFSLLWWDAPEPATQLIGMPVVSYWWGLGMRAFGESESLAKLWMFPFPWLLCVSLHGLLRRWAGSWANPVLFAAVLGPALLPSLNLMLDVPELALELTALLALVKAMECWAAAGSRSARGEARAALLTVLAGVSAGLATETKYTGLIAPFLLVALAWLLGRPRLGVLSAVIAGLLFVSWELFAFVRYAGSALLRGPNASPGLARKLDLVIPLLGILGSVGPWVGLASAAALGVARRALAGAGTLVIVSLATVALVPKSLARLSESRREELGGWTVDLVLFVVLGVAVFVTLVAVCRRLLTGCGDRIGLFAVTWLVLEILFYFVATPFPAVRRVLGVIIAGFVVAGRGLARAAPQPSRLFRGGFVVGSVACGLFFQGIDVLEARAQREAVREAASWIRANDPRSSPPVWYVGHWGFQHYAEQAGMKPAVSGRFSQATPLNEGDWLVVPSDRVAQQSIQLKLGLLRLVRVVKVRDPLPVATLPFFYDGNSALGRLERPRLRVDIYSVLRAHVP
jgi:hypothetical protein